MRLALCALWLVSACSGSGVARTACDDLCDDLVSTCGYAAFPDPDSCLSGCAYYDANGADVAGQASCVEDAACDTFLIVECEHEYGLEQ